MHQIELAGCSPDPLIMNLKALGIFRIIAEQADPGVRAEWDWDIFVLHTHMNKDILVDFFMNKYIPTPLISPWNGGSGLSDKQTKNKLSEPDRIKKNPSSRLAQYRCVIDDVKEILEDHIPEYVEFKKDANKKNAKALKVALKEKKKFLLTQFRNTLPDDLLPWLDAIYAVKDQKIDFGPILGSGGNDGNFEIGATFMGLVDICIPKDKDELKNSKSWIRGSLFGERCKLKRSSQGYFHPGLFRGSDSFVNPWDFILAVEGSLLFAGSISKRSKSTMAAFPFSTRTSHAGYGTSSGNEKSRGEIWMPLWSRPATYREIKYVFTEGRSQIGKNDSRSGVEFARAVASYGVERGISEFQRFGIFERKGQAYFANGLGKIKNNPRSHVDLLTEIDPWLNNIRKIKNRPNSANSVLHNMDNLVMEYCSTGRKSILQKILVNIGLMEQIVSCSSSMQEYIKPLQTLSTQWINACYDRTPEFRIALALATISDKNKVYPVRFNLEPITRDFKWRTSSPDNVFKKQNTIQNMISILERRCIVGQIGTIKIRDSLRSIIRAPILDIMMFINGQVDYGKIGELMYPLSMIKYNDDYKTSYDNKLDLWNLPDGIPEAYISLKSNFPPSRLIINNETKYALFEPTILGLIKSGRFHEACYLTHRRLHITGKSPLTYKVRAKHRDVADVYTSQIMRARLAASLLIPVGYSDLDSMIGKISTKS